MRHGTGRQARARFAGRRPGPLRAPVYGAVDLGTSNCRMLMAKPAGGDFRVVGSFSRIGRLGEGLAASGRRSDEAIARTVDALKVCAGKMRAHAVRQVRGVATEACRRAGNCAEFLHRVKAETGLALESISPVEEAKLTLTGCAPLLDAACPRALVFDIGGGSTELMWIGLAAGRAPRMLGLLSLKHGVVTLAERHFGDIAPGEVAWVRLKGGGETISALGTAVLGAGAKFHHPRLAASVNEAKRNQLRPREPA